MRIDLHVHSSASDGTLSPADLVRAARAADLDLLALTDHDTVAGLAEAGEEAARAGLRLLPGVEISCAMDGVSLHLLAYGADTSHPELATELARCRDDRVPRAQEMVRRLAAAGHPITWSMVADLAGEGTVGRPHVADALVRVGAVPDREAAFAQLLRPEGSFYVRHHAAPAADAVRLVRRAGGVPVFAHPGAARRGPTVDDEAVARLAEAGLFALEVDHPDHDRPTREHLRGLAAELGLQITGASDFHGSGRAQRLGAETTHPDVLEALLAEVGR